MLVRVLGSTDAAAFRTLRIRALREHPPAFRRTPEEHDEELMALEVKPS